VVHNQLAPAAKEIGERFFTIRSVEGVLLLDLLLGQLVALSTSG
jgi:hypothetical protein